MGKKQTEFITENATYILQHPGIRYTDEMSDKSMDKNGRYMPHKNNELIMKDVIVSPAVNYEYFDEIDGNKSEEIEVNGRTYKFIYPTTKELSKMAYYFADDEGRASQVKMKEQLMKHVIRYEDMPVDYDFFEEIGNVKEFNEVTTKSGEFIYKTEFMEVMTECRRFLGGEEE